MTNSSSWEAMAHRNRWFTELNTWWLIPLSKWVVTPITSGITLLIPFITGVITHLLSGMSHQVAWWIFPWRTVSHNQMVICVGSLRFSSNSSELNRHKGPTDL